LANPSAGCIYTVSPLHVAASVILLPATFLCHRGLHIVRDDFYAKKKRLLCSRFFFVSFFSPTTRTGLEPPVSFGRGFWAGKHSYPPDFGY